jgi:hypothetical protein
MRKTRMLLISGLILALGAPVLAQFRVPAVKAPSAVINHIPADAMAYVVINDMEASSKKVDNFLKMIGADEEVGGPTLAMLKGLAGLGEGFAPKNGMGIAVLDFQKFGIDVMEMMEGGVKKLPPIIVYMPGSSLEGIMPNVQASKVGDYKQFQLPGVPMPMMAKEIEGFVAVSPLAGALEAMTKSVKPASASLNGSRAMVLARSDLFINFNMEIVGPLYMKMLKESTKDMKRIAQTDPDMAPMVSLMDWYEEFYGEILQEMQDVSMSLRMDDEAVLLEEVFTYKAGGKLSTMSVPGTQASAKKLLGRLPDNNYIFAMGGVGSSEAASEQSMAFINEALKTFDKHKGQLPVKLPENTTARLRSLFETYFNQVQGMHMVVGGAPNNNGLFNAAFVLDVKDAGKVQDMFAAKAQLLQDIIHTAMEDNPMAQQFSIVRKRGVTTLEGQSIDAFAFEHPVLQQMPEEGKGQMMMVLGETAIRFLTAAPNNETVVVTFGGGSDGMSAALKAFDGGDVTQAAGVDKALAVLPEKSNFAMLFSPANLITVIRNGYGKMMPWGEFPFSFNVEDPISMGATSGQTEGHIVFRVPNTVIQETVRIVEKMEQANRGGRGGARPRGGEDF